MTETPLRQYELQKGTTHWIAWLDYEQLGAGLEGGWAILHAYNTKLYRNKSGVLTESQQP